MTITHLTRTSYTQPFTQRHINNDSITCNFDSHLQQEQYIMNQLTQQATIFAALQMATEINQLNNRQVVSSYQLAKVKNHFLKNKIVKSEKQLSEKRKSENEYTRNQKSKTERDHFLKQYQKAYLQLLSV